MIKLHYHFNYPVVSRFCRKEARKIRSTHNYHCLYIGERIMIKIVNKSLE